MTLHIVVRVGNERFAFDATAVEEAVDAPVVEWVPVAPDAMLGQLQHRGRMIGAWDAGRLFHLGTPTRAGAAIVLRDGAGRVALAVDDVTEMTRFEAIDLRPAPPGSDPEGVLSGVSVHATGGGAALVNVVRVDALTALMSRRAAPAGGVTR